MIKEKLRQIALKIIHFLNTKRNNSNKWQFIRSQPHYSEVEDYVHKIQQHHNIIQQKNHWNDINQPDDIFQPDIFEPYMNSQQPRQITQQSSQRQHLAHSNETSNHNTIQIIKITKPNQ